jgi:ribonuclease III
VKLSAEVQAFAGRIGHRFADPSLLVRALTHASMSAPSRPDNQRLEFLGDRVLGLAISRALFVGDLSASEGQLAPRFNALVRKETCADVARSVGLGEVLRLGRSEMLSGGRRKDALLGDAMEAVIAAVFLDAGFDAAEAMVLRLWQSHLLDVQSISRDPKTALQEWAQGRGQRLPDYREIARTGPDHAPAFTVEVHLDSGLMGAATAPSKRAAEQAAAADLLARLEAQDD